MKTFTVVSLDKDVFVRNESGQLTLVKVGDVLPETVVFERSENAHVIVESNQITTALNVTNGASLNQLFDNAISQASPDTDEQQDIQPVENQVSTAQDNTARKNEADTDNNDTGVIDDGHYLPSAEVVEFNELEIDVNSNGRSKGHNSNFELYNFTTDEEKNSSNALPLPSLFGHLGFLNVDQNLTNNPVTMIGSFQGASKEDDKLVEDGDISLKGGGILSNQTLSGKYGTLSLDASGHWHYQLNNSSKETQALNEGENVEEHFNLEALNNSGSKITHDLVISIEGTNDKPVLSINPESSTQGHLVETDVDNQDTHTFSTANGAGNFGVLSVDALTGSYVYTQNTSVIGMNYNQSNNTYSGEETFEISVKDNHGGVSTKYISMHVEATVTAPTTPDGDLIVSPHVTGSPVLTDTNPNIPLTNNQNTLTNTDPTQTIGTQTGGSQTAGSQTVGSQTGGSQTGGSQTGGSQTGGSQTGGSQTGGSQTGGSQTGGSQTGGSQTGGSQTGGSQIGGSQIGGSQTGGSQTGGSQTGGSQTGGSQTGGSQIGGSQTGGSQTGSQANQVTLHLDKSSDSGKSDSDAITHEQQLTITGTTSIPFTKVDIINLGQVVGSARADAQGHYQVITSQFAANSHHTLTAQATDPSGTIHTTSSPLNILIDTSVNAKDDVNATSEDNNTILSGNVLNNDDHKDNEMVTGDKFVKYCSWPLYVKFRWHLYVHFRSK